MNAREVTRFMQIDSQSLVQFVGDLVGVALELLCTIFGELGDCWLCGVPEAWTILVEISRAGRKSSQRISEYGRRLSRHDATKLHPTILESAVRRGCRWGRAKIDGARHASSRVQLAEVWLFG